LKILVIKTWLETTGLSVAENSFSTPPSLPYIVFNESKRVYGADSANMLADRSIDIELYSLKVDHTSEELIEALLNAKAISYQKEETVYIPSERFYMTNFSFGITERI